MCLSHAPRRGPPSLACICARQRYKSAGRSRGCRSARPQLNSSQPGFRCAQVTGSFKARGAVNKVLQLSARSARLPLVTTASTGNHALAVTYALKTLAPGADFCIYLPSNASAAKVSALRAQGARLCLVEADDCERAEVAAREAAAAAGGEFISPYNDLEVAAGQGTIAVELLQQVQDLHAVFVPVGGGGMIAGIASHLKAVAPHVKVVGCQPASNACMHASLQAGRVLGEGEFANGATWSDGTAGGIEAGSLTFAACAEGVDEWVLVSEAAIAEAMQDFMAEQHKIIEGSAGVALAAFRARAADFAGCNAAVVCCGANLPLDKVAMLAQAAASKAH